MSAIGSIFLRAVIVAFIILVTEFYVRNMLYIRLLALFPNQKYKTIGKKIKNRKFIEQLKLFFVLDYDNSFKGYCFIIMCYIFRLYSLILLLSFVICKMPNQYVSVMFTVWEIILCIVGVILLRKQ